MTRPSAAVVNDSAQPLDTFEADYRKAVVHLAWLQLTDNQTPSLLFGWVELLPAEVPPPPNCPTERHRIGTAAEVAVAHVVTDATTAMHWYSHARKGQVSTVDNDGQWTNSLSTLSPFCEEPTWPSMVCDSGEVPFVPSSWDYPRVHHVLPASHTPSSRESLEEPVRASLIAFLSGRFHFPFDEYPEYLGSVHLVAPNPIFRELHQRLHPNREELWVRLEPRAGRPLADLSISVREGRPTGVVCHLGTATGSEWLRFRLAGQAQTLSIQVIDEKRGLLFDEPSSVFLQGFTTTMYMASSRVVSTPSDSYEVSVRGEAREIHTGECQTESSGAQRFYSAAGARRERQAANSSDQYWIDSRELARRTVRGLVHQANTELLLVDAWFSSLDLYEFVLALGGSCTMVKILCGTGVHSKDCDSKAPNSNREDKKVLHQELNKLKDKGIYNKFAVRIMPGRRKPRIHDRFLVCDEEVWSIGSSLNHLGERESAIIRLPAPQPVCARVNAIWEQSTDLEVWLGTNHEGNLA